SEKFCEQVFEICIKENLDFIIILREFLNFDKSFLKTTKILIKFIEESKISGKLAFECLSEFHLFLYKYRNNTNLEVLNLERISKYICDTFHSKNTNNVIRLLDVL